MKPHVYEQGVITSLVLAPEIGMLEFHRLARPPNVNQQRQFDSQSQSVCFDYQDILNQHTFAIFMRNLDLFSSREQQIYVYSPSECNIQKGR